MEQAAEATNDAPSNDAVSTETVTTTAEPSRPAGYEPVDLSGLPPELAKPIEDRFSYLYRQVKDNGRTLYDYRKIAADQSKRIEELTNGFGQVVDHIQEKTFSDTETSLKQQMRTAYEAGNTDAYLDAQSKLDDIRLEKKLAERQPKEQRQPQQQVQQQNPDDGITPAVAAWQSERDDAGNMLRPWTNPQNANYQQAYAELMAIKNNPNYRDADEMKIMMELDKRMGVKQRTVQQNVMGGNLTGRGKSNKITLTSKQQEIAVRTKFGSRDGAKSDADYIDAYRKQIEKTTGVKK